ncbi:flippase [Clostridium botulinum]|uniref:flippase n=1 Tax=Clostridium botulinum TaxID=1491 RepID=UPI000D13E50D|nr:flippase [Clostridium botulinum]AVQ44379.1 hypothetical protein C7M60_00650 [Clostridium botulinum]AVQ47922.1 hypothetical protein C7M58_00645 [Clostridium botulinum]
MKLLKKVLILMFGSGLSKIIDMIYMMILVRLLSIKNYATYQQVNLVINTLMPFLILGIPISLSYFIPKLSSKEESKTLVIQTHIMMTIIALIGAFGIVIFSNSISMKFSNSDLNYYLKLQSLYLFLEVSMSYYPNYYLATDRSKKLASITFIFSTIKFVSFFICVDLLNNKNLTYIFICIILTSLVKYIYIFIEVYSYYRDVKFKSDFLLFKKQFLYSIPIGFSTIIGMLSITLDKNMISYFFTPEQYAIFSNGAFEIPLIGIITGSVTSVVIPEFSKLYNGHKENNYKILDVWNKSIIACSAILIPVGFGLFLYSKGFIMFLFSEKYLESTIIFRIYLLILPLRSINFGSLLMTSGYQNKILYNTTIGLIMNFILNIIFIKIYGVTGAAIATVISTYILACLQSHQIKKVFKVSYKDIFPWKKISYIFMICISNLWIYLFSHMYPIGEVVKFLVFGFIYIIINLIMFYKFNIVNYKVGKYNFK